MGENAIHFGHLPDRALRAATGLPGWLSWPVAGLGKRVLLGAFLALSALYILGSGCKPGAVGPSDLAQKPSTAPAADGKLALINGSCAGRRELGDLGVYAMRLQAKQNSLGFIRVRREAIWTLEDMSNVLGTVPCGTVLWGAGPLKNAEHSMGVGYAVAIRDAEGRQCRGYVSFTVVEEVPK